VQDGAALIGGYRLFRLEGLWFWHSMRSRGKHRDYEVTEAPYLKREIARHGIPSD